MRFGPARPARLPRRGGAWVSALALGQVYHRMPLEECLKLSIRFMTCFLETVEAFGGTVAGALAHRKRALAAPAPARSCRPLGCPLERSDKN
jgi:hypothetical protein